MKIIYTYTDEAPALATHSLLPIVEAFAAPPASRSSCATSRWPDASSPSSPTGWRRAAPRRARRARRAGQDARGEHHQAAEHQRLDPAAEGGDQGAAGRRATPSRTTRTIPRPTSERDVRARYDRVKGSAVNPVLREGNSDRRAPASVKAYARKHPHSMGAWSTESKSHVSTMSDGDFRSTEQSVTLAEPTTRCGSSTSPPTAR